MEFAWVSGRLVVSYTVYVLGGFLFCHFWCPGQGHFAGSVWALGHSTGMGAGSEAR